MNLSLQTWGIIAFVVSLCSYLYELVLIQLAGDLSNNNFLIINLSLGSFILALGLGLNDLPSNLSKEEAEKKFIDIERRLCISALSAWLIIQVADFLQQHFLGLVMIQEITNPLIIKILEQYHFYILCGSIVSSIIIGYRSGQELPLIIKLTEGAEHHTGLLFGLNYLGSMVASVCLNFLLKPFLSVELILGCTVSINFAIFLFLKHRNNTKISSFPVAFLLGIFFLYYHFPINYNLKNYYYHFSALSLDPKIFPEVFSQETPYQKIHLHYNAKEQKVLSLNRQFQFSFNNESIYHDALVHLPMKMSNSPVTKVLLLGGGDGLALRELLKYPHLEITQIELDEEFTEFCRTHPEISKLNQGSLNETIRVKRKYGDAFSLVKKEKTKFDAILVDFPYPFSYDLWKLYSVEFYLSLKKLMKEKSFLILDAPVQSQAISKLIGNKKSEKLNSTVFSTLQKAGFDFVSFYSLQKEGFVFASLKPYELNRDHISLDFLSPETVKRIEVLKSERFIYQYDEKLVNSIFKPQFLDFNRDF